MWGPRPGYEAKGGAGLSTIPFIVLFGLLGAAIGSFAGALQTRWPVGRSIIAGRSTCDSCNMPLVWYTLIPIVSWLGLRGRCLHCRAEIDGIQPASELACLLVAVASAILFGSSASVATAWAGAIFGWLLVPLALIDARHFWLPDPLVLTLALAGAGFALAGIGPTPILALAGGILGFGTLWLIAAVFRMRTGRDGLGGGDPKLLGAIGLWCGADLLPAIMLVAAGLGLAWAMLARWRGVTIDRNTRLPLGTLLAAAAWPLWLWHMAA